MARKMTIQQAYSKLFTYSGLIPVKVTHDMEVVAYGPVDRCRISWHYVNKPIVHSALGFTFNECFEKLDEELERRS